MVRRSRIIWGTVAGVVVIVVAAIMLTRVDWDGYGEAQLPVTLETPNNSQVTIDRLEFAGVDALTETPELVWSQYVEVKLQATCIPDTFRISHPGMQLGEASRTQVGRLRPSIHIEILRRSSLADGTKLISQMLSGARVDPSNRLRWSNRIWVPRTPGMYRVRVVLKTRPVTARRDRRRIYDETVIGGFNLKVIPEQATTADLSRTSVGSSS